MSEPIVSVEQGKLRGKLFKTLTNYEYYSFKGIPFAKPVTGELRFSVPQPPEPWEGIKDATKDCNICAQYDKVSQSVIGDEDCLYLNIYTPVLPSTECTALPVMVYFHGGGFVFGNGTDPTLHGPDYLITKNVVLVIPNYRVGVLGFLTLDLKEAPGNMGLRDQVQALQWVQKNIDKFNGDCKNVTIFGISAGGASVEYLTISPIAKGLFHKAIAQSGSSLLHWAQNDRNKIKALALTMAKLNGNVLTNDVDLLNYLKGLSTKELIDLSMKALAADNFKGSIHFGFVPTVEKTGDWEPFLNKSTYELLSKGEFNKIPFMTGFCEREGLLSVSHGPDILKTLTKEKIFINHFPFELDTSEKMEMENKLKTVYLEGEKKSKDNDAFAIDFFTDVDFLGGIYVSAKLIAKNSSPLYFYEFAYDGTLNYVKKGHGIDREGAAHGDDGGYLLKCDKLGNNLTEMDLVVQNVMLTAWTNFAKYGNPTPITDNLIPITWKPFTEKEPACFVIDKKVYMKKESDMYPERMKIYKEIYERKHDANC